MKMKRRREGEKERRREEMETRESAYNYRSGEISNGKEKYKSQVKVTNLFKCKV
jgi:hypothetical protein